jgi:hypothetical protein
MIVITPYGKLLLVEGATTLIDLDEARRIAEHHIFLYSTRVIKHPHGWGCYFTPTEWMSSETLEGLIQQIRDKVAGILQVEHLLELTIYLPPT